MADCRKCRIGSIAQPAEMRGNMTNILILSAGTRDKVVQYFKKALAGKGQVIATDCSEYAPAIYEADGYELVPRITEPGYLERILEICKKRKITGVLSLIDPELSLLAANKERFLEIGTTPVVPDAEAVELCFNKYAMYEKLTELGFPTGKCFMDREAFFEAVDAGMMKYPVFVKPVCGSARYAMYEKLTELGFPTGKCFMDREAFFEAVDAGMMKYPVFVKPVCGSASISINKAADKETVEFLCSREEDLMIQEFMDGQEYGADVYIDMLSGEVVSIFVKKKLKMRAGETGQEYGADVYIDMLSGEVVSIFVKKKLKMRAGETDKAVSVKDEALFSLIRDFVKKMGFRGIIDIDLFEIGGKWYISEVNPRFGGGYPHAYVIRDFVKKMGFRGIIDIDLFEIGGKWYISEVNPRFGGGYPHAYVCGVNVPELIVNNLEGRVNEPAIGNYEAGMVMMKYNEIMVKRI